CELSWRQGGLATRSDRSLAPRQIRGDPGGGTGAAIRRTARFPGAGGAYEDDLQWRPTRRYYRIACAAPDEAERARLDRSRFPGAGDGSPRGAEATLPLSAHR